MLSLAIMLISGLVVTLAGDGREGLEQVERLSCRRSLTLGERQWALLPVVAEAESEAESEEVFNELRDLPGVMTVDVVYVQTSYAELSMRAA